MKTIYYSIRSVYAPDLLYYLTKTIFENDVLSNVTKRITEASAMRLMKYAFLNFKLSEWRGNIFTFVVDEPEELSQEENERIDEILNFIPELGNKEPISDERLNVIMAYFGRDLDEIDSEG